MIKWYENISKDLNVPLIMLDIPYNPEYDPPKEQIEYVKAQFYDAIHQLEELTGKEWNEETFRQVMENSNRTGRAWLKAAGYANVTPSPLNGFDLFNHMAVACCARGTVEGAQAFEKLAQEYIALIGLNGKEHRFPHELSGGEQQRIAIARALVKNPPIILADEPTGNLDSHTGIQILDLLTNRCRESGTTLVMVSHSLKTCEYADRILRMSDGRIVEEESCEGLAP